MLGEAIFSLALTIVDMRTTLQLEKTVAGGEG
jgi:hypothetical protein